MTTDHLSEQAEIYLDKLCNDLPNRRVGSRGNRMATDFFKDSIRAFGFKTEQRHFDCMDWRYGDVKLTVGSRSFTASVSPYSLGCNVQGPLAVVSTVEELQRADLTEKVVLLGGDITKEQLMPKNFPFYNPDEHKQIISLLEDKKPLAIVAATSRNPELAGGLYPFPLFEDGDFDIPSVYMKDIEGDRLARYAGQEIALISEAQRIPMTGCNVIARKGLDPGTRIVICAHIDAKIDTPGALDNGTGIVVLLLLAELLADYEGQAEIEIVAINGEDYYAASGEILYIEENKGRFGEMMLSVNTDVAGYHEGSTAYSLYTCPDEIAASIRNTFSESGTMIEGEPWYQSDHSIFIQNGVPAMAITSDQFMELSTYITHTPGDTTDIVDYSKLAEIALAIKTLILDLHSSTLE